MKRMLVGWMCVLVLCGIPALGLALEVAEGVITTAVSERAPVDEVQTYSAAAGTLYCFTRIVGAAGETAVTHVWYRDGLEMARVELPVRSSSWRTWSSKTLLPSWTGSWTVEVLDAEQNLLATIPFQLN